MSDFPKFPPPPDDLGEYLMYVTAGIEKFGFDRKGTQVLITFRVDDEYSKTILELLTLKGRQFNLPIYTPRGRRALVASKGPKAVAAMAKKVQEAE